MAERISTFREFWPFYVGEHANALNRKLHFIGTTFVIAIVIGALVTGRSWLWALAPVFGYGFAWVGHFRIEHNRPATFKYPLYSLAADFVMWWKIATGKMDAEVQAVLRK